MGKREQILSGSRLFEGIDPREIEQLLPCLRPKILNPLPGELLLEPGEEMTQLLIVLAGTVRVEDAQGTVRAGLEPGMSFGETLACAGAVLPWSLIAGEGCEVLRIDCRRALTPCDHSCRYHKRLMRNLVREIAEGRLKLEEHLEILSQRTTREKLLCYLRAQARLQGADEFTIPLDRQGLADYLGVERSAMSAEIGKLCRDGVIETKRSWFKLL